MLKNYFTIAIRNILRNKAISFINIFGLAISMSVCLLLILIVADQYAYDEFHTQEDSIYRIITDRVEEKQYEWSTATVPLQLGDELKNHSAIDKVTIIDKHFGGIAQWRNQEIPFSGLYTDNQFLQIFDFPLEKGSRAKALSQPNSIVLSHELANKIFGDSDPINETIEIENVGQFVVTGVLKEFPGKSHLSFEALGSIATYIQNEKSDTTSNNWYKEWSNIYSNYTYFTTKPGADVNTLKPHLKKIAKDKYVDISNMEYTFKIQALDDITPGPLLSNTTGFGLPLVAVYMMIGVACIILLSACFNYANLTTARAINRAKEIGVRKVVGARKGHIFSQFMVEAVIIAIVAFIFADLTVQFVVPLMNNYFASLGAPMQFEETPYLYFWFLLFVICAGIIAGLVPSLFFSATNPLVALKKSIQLEQLGKRLGFFKLNIRRVLLVVQFTFSVVFIITMLAFYQQLQFVMNTDHGFDTEHIVNVPLQGVPYEKLAYKYEELAAVEKVAAASHMPALGTNNTSLVRFEGMEEPAYISTLIVGGDFIESMNLEMIAGVDFPKVIPKDERFIIINEAALKQFNLGTPEEAIGQVLNLDERIDAEILGVIKDFHYERLDEKIGPMGLRFNPNLTNKIIVKLVGNEPKETLAEMEAIWKEVTNRPFEYSYYSEELRLSYAHFEALMIVSGYVTIIVVSIACLGFLGMVMYHVQNKTKEIGVRKTLGAGAFDILRVVGRQFLILLIIAFSIGGPIAFFFNNLWLETNEYRFDFGWPTLLSGIGILLLIVTATVGAQVYKALQVNPSDSLRNE